MLLVSPLAGLLKKSKPSRRICFRKKTCGGATILPPEYFETTGTSGGGESYLIDPNNYWAKKMAEGSQMYVDETLIKALMNKA